MRFNPNETGFDNVAGSSSIIRMFCMGGCNNSEKMERARNTLLEFLRTTGMLGFTVHFVAQSQPLNPKTLWTISSKQHQRHIFAGPAMLSSVICFT